MGLTAHSQRAVTALAVALGLAVAVFGWQLLEGVHDSVVERDLRVLCAAGDVEGEPCLD